MVLDRWPEEEEEGVLVMPTVHIKEPDQNPGHETVALCGEHSWMLLTITQHHPQATCKRCIKEFKERVHDAIYEF